MAGDPDKPKKGAVTAVDKAGITQAQSEAEAGARPEAEKLAEAPLLTHLQDLRRLILSSLLFFLLLLIPAYLVSARFFTWLVGPYGRALPEDQTAQLYFAPLEFFFARLKLSLMLAIALSLPFILYRTYRFIDPALYKKEKFATVISLAVFPFLFLLGASFVHWVVMPALMRFASAMQFDTQLADGRRLAVSLLLKVGDYVNLELGLMMAFGLAFQLPVVLWALARAGLLEATDLRRSRRVVVVGVFLLAAFLTPPDPLSQLLLAGALLSLYELAIGVVAWTNKPARRSLARSSEEGR